MAKTLGLEGESGVGRRVAVDLLADSMEYAYWVLGICLLRLENMHFDS